MRLYHASCATNSSPAAGAPTFWRVKGGFALEDAVSLLFPQTRILGVVGVDIGTSGGSAERGPELLGGC